MMTEPQDLVLTSEEPETVSDAQRVETPTFFDAYLAVARRKLGVGDDWHWFHREVLDDDSTLMKGGFPNLTGRKRDRWKGVRVYTAVVTDAECEAARQEYETRTGKCSGCAGGGKTLKSVGIDRVTGQTYRTFRECATCAGSGAATRWPAEVNHG